MLIVSETYAILIFIIIIIVSALIAWFMGSHEYYEGTRFHTFIAVLAGLGIIVTFLFYYNLIAIQNQQQQLNSLQELSRIQESMLNGVLNGIKTSSTIIPNFVLSITPLTNNACCGETGCTIPTTPDPVNAETCSAKMTLSYRIFALWQDVILTNKSINFDQVSYVSNFLQRANSNQLYSQWKESKLNFTTDTQTFGDLLFEYGLPITIQTPQEYITAANKLIQDPRFQSLIK